MKNGGSTQKIAPVQSEENVHRTSGFHGLPLKPLLGPLKEPQSESP